MTSLLATLGSKWVHLSFQLSNLASLFGIIAVQASAVVALLMIYAMCLMFTASSDWIRGAQCGAISQQEETPARFIGVTEGIGGLDNQTKR